MPLINEEDLIKIVSDLQELQELRNEVAFLRERNKDLRQKTWFPVYDENIKLRKELKDCYESLDGLYQDFDELAKDNSRLKEVLRSVETFVKQFT
jgi:predicted nuclease with TOPRIM domain